MGARRKLSRRESLAAALRHPTRRRILDELRAAPESPRQLSGRLGEPLSHVSYHFRVLAECEVLEPVRTRPARGVVEHFYRVAITDEEMLEALAGGVSFSGPEGEETD